MYTLLVVLSAIFSILLIIIVLLQASKGDGLAGGTFGGAGGMGTMFGARRTADFLSKGTWWLAGALAIMAIVINLFFLPGQSTSQQRESIIQKSGRTAVPQQGSLPQQSQPVPQQNNNSK